MEIMPKLVHDSLDKFAPTILQQLVTLPGDSQGPGLVSSQNARSKFETGDTINGDCFARKFCLHLASRWIPRGRASRWQWRCGRVAQRPCTLLVSTRTEWMLMSASLRQVYARVLAVGATSHVAFWMCLG